MEVPDVVSDWREAFGVAYMLHREGRLTALAVVSATEFSQVQEGKAFVATHLAEFGDAEQTLVRLQMVSLKLYGEKAGLRLHHGPVDYARPDGSVDGALLTIVYQK